MIRVVAMKDGLAMPQFCCDYCLEPITDISMAMVIWYEDLLKAGQSTATFVIHKGKCDRRLTASKNAINGGWHELHYSLELIHDRVRK